MYYRFEDDTFANCMIKGTFINENFLVLPSSWSIFNIAVFSKTHTHTHTQKDDHFHAQK
jgi:hypothetical protein